MSYESEVLADAPVFYARLDELSGSQMTDLSGNGHHGTYDASASRGLASPIETDAASYAVRGIVGQVPAAAGSLWDLTGNFTWECWGYYDTSVLLSQTGHLINRRGQFGLSQSCQIGFNSGTIQFDLDEVGAAFHSISYSGLQNQTWYHIVGVRNGTVMLLYVNGVLRAQDTGLTGADIDYNVAGSDWYIGRSINTTIFSSAGTDEVALYNTPLSVGRVLAHYEAALASLPLRATITISIGLELNTDQIVPVNLGFLHNYSQTFADGPVPIVEELSYKTNLNQSEPDYQQRISARPHGALRTLEYHLSPNSGAARARLQGHLYGPAQFYCVPVWSDAGVLTGTASSGTNTLSLDTTKRDYEVGSYVGICSDLQDPSTYQFFKITGVTDTQLTLDSNIATTVASGSPVFPARVCSISEDTLSVKSFAADHEDSVIRFEVIESELSTRRITAYTPGITYKSIEVFSLETAKVFFLDDRPYDINRRIQSLGRDYQYAMDSGSPQTFPVRFLLTSRTALSEFYGWLDARLGKLNPVWVSTKEKDLIATGHGVTTLTIKKTGFSFHHGRRDVELLQTNGTVSRMRVTAVVDNGNGTETWTFDQSVPAYTDIARISFLKFVTLSSDTIQIRYWKGGSNGAVIAESSLAFRELLTSPT